MYIIQYNLNFYENLIMLIVIFVIHRAININSFSNTNF